MPSHPTGGLQGLDTLRVLAIALVMLYHAHSFAPDPLDPVCKLGWMGVDLFFALSGYLVGRQLLRPPRLKLRDKGTNRIPAEVLRDPAI